MDTIYMKMSPRRNGILDCRGVENIYHKSIHTHYTLSSQSPHNKVVGAFNRLNHCLTGP